MEGLKELPDRSIHCCVTSPPYWGLRDYGTSDQLGLEETPQEYVDNMVKLFRQVRRVLKDDGTLWLNLGDSYGEGKQLCGIPWMVAFALQADGWYLRQDIIWHKPNPMPESVTDRCTKSHEYIFLLTKSARYYYDVDAIKEDSIYAPDKTHEIERAKGYYKGKWSNPKKGSRHDGSFKAIREKRNKRSVWTVTTKPYKEAHFAVYPEKLIEPCIKAGTSAHGCCADCGAPWERILAKGEKVKQKWGTQTKVDKSRNDVGLKTGMVNTYYTTGWQPTCQCECKKIVPAIVLDPFMGAGTTGLVARKLSRHYVGYELNAEYIKIAEKRIFNEIGLFL